MTFDDQEVLRRFHGALVREIQAHNPEHLLTPFTVAEIYQNLVPYRTHRDELGVEMNADYEHALLRLLAGEGEFLVLESASARKEIREELDSPNPNTGLYREFAAAEVRLNQELIDDALSGASSRSPGEEAPLHEEAAEVSTEMGTKPMEEDPSGIVEMGGQPADLDLSEHPPEVDGGATHSTSELEAVLEEEGEEMHDPGSHPEVAESAGKEDEETLDLPFDTCPWCRENLPQRPGVRFCPFCGSNVRLVPCPACGEELELNWRFCVACGTEVAS